MSTRGEILLIGLFFVALLGAAGWIAFRPSDSRNLYQNVGPPPNPVKMPDSKVAGN
jgi:hypothetical protein